MADRTPQELPEALNDLAADCYDETIKPDLIAAANLLSGLEGREDEYRAAGTIEGEAYETIPLEQGAAPRIARRLGLTVQKRTVYESQWTDIEEGD